LEIQDLIMDRHNYLVWLNQLWGSQLSHRETQILIIQENKHVISWCFSLLSFYLCQIWWQVNLLSSQ
jgi:hypothetical protein